MASGGHREWAPQEQTPELVAFEAGILKKMTLVMVFRNSVFRSGLLTNNDRLRLRTCSELTRLALRAYLKDYYRQQAALGDPGRPCSPLEALRWPPSTFSWEALHGVGSQSELKRALKAAQA